MNTSEFILAAAQGNLEAVQQYIDENPELINVKDSRGFTALIRAADSGRIEVVQALLTVPDIDVNATTNYQDGLQSTALMIAAENGHIEVVQALLNIPSVNVFSRNGMDKTALMLAIEKGRVDIVRTLLARARNDVNETFTSALANGVYHSFLNDALIHAIQKKHVELVQILLAVPDINVNGINDDIPLIKAILSQQIEIVRIFLNLPNIYLNVIDRGGFNILKIAERTGNREIEQLIRDRLLRRNHQLSSGREVFTSAVQILDQIIAGASAIDQTPRRPVPLATSRPRLLQHDLDSPSSYQANVRERTITSTAAPARPVPQTPTFQQRLEAINYQEEIPEDLRDTITLDIMNDPVTLPSTGFTYDRASLSRWVEGENKLICPMTKQPITKEELKSACSVTIKKQIEAFVSAKEAEAKAKLDKGKPPADEAQTSAKSDKDKGPADEPQTSNNAESENNQEALRQARLKFFEKLSAPTSIAKENRPKKGT